MALLTQLSSGLSRLTPSDAELVPAVVVEGVSGSQITLKCGVMELIATVGKSPRALSLRLRNRLTGYGPGMTFSLCEGRAICEVLWRHGGSREVAFQGDVHRMIFRSGPDGATIAAYNLGSGDDAINMCELVGMRREYLCRVITGLLA